MGSVSDLNISPGPATTAEATTAVFQGSANGTLATLPVRVTTTVWSVGAALTRAANRRF